MKNNPCKGVMDKLFAKPLEKVVKEVLIAKSGIYQYAKQELPGLGLDSVPAEYSSQNIFNVYRPALVLAKSAHLFTRLPITDEHPSAMLTNADFQRHIVGYTGDSSSIQWLKDDEVYIKSTASMLGSTLIAEYENGKREVSPGYYGQFKWQKGVAKDGTPYEIVMTAIEDVNHLAVVRNGRGGPSASILDHKGVPTMKLISGLYYAIFKKRKGIADEDMGEFRHILTGLLTGEDTGGIEKAKGLIAYLPESEGKSKLARYIEDLAHIKSLPEEEAKEAIEIVASLFEKLDSEAMADYMGSEKPVEEPVAEEPAVEDVTTEEPSVEEGVANDIEPGSPDADPKTTPGNDDVATEEPATEEPATEEPATEEPATEEPATEEPVVAKPETGLTPEQLDYIVKEVVVNVQKYFKDVKATGEDPNAMDSAPASKGVTMDTPPGSGDGNSKQSIEDYFSSEIKKKR